METDKQATGKNRKDVFILFFITFGIVFIGLIAQYLIYIGYSFSSAKIGIDVKMGLNNTIFQIPLKQIFDSLIYITLLYGGGQSAFAFVKSGTSPKGELQRMPYYKFIRLRWIIALWVISTILSTIFQILTTEPKILDFYMNESYKGFGIGVSTYVSAYLAPKVGEDINFKDIYNTLKRKDTGDEVPPDSK